MTRGEPVRVLIVDDHPVYRAGLSALFEHEDGVVVVAQSDSGRRAVELAESLLPDVVLMDIGLADLDGISATRQIVGTNPHIAVLMLSMHDDDSTVFAAMCAGGRGYLLKEADHDEIVRAVRATANGEAVFGSRVAQQVLGFFASPAGRDQRIFPRLTEREREVLELIAQGRGNAQIARALAITPKTVRNHASNIFVKLQVADRAEAIVTARVAGLGKAPEYLGTPARDVGTP